MRAAILIVVAESPAGSFPFDRRDGEHRLHRALEVAAVVDGPGVIERDRLVRRVDHRLCRARQRLQRCQGQSPNLAGSAWKSPPSASAMAWAIRSTMFTALRGRR